MIVFILENIGSLFVGDILVDFGDEEFLFLVLVFYLMMVLIVVSEL